jgi:ornithine carbamoyltransferase
MTRHFLNLSDAGGDAIAAIIADAIDRKAARAGLPKGTPDKDTPLAGRTLAMVFEKNSTRTRVSFDMVILDAGTTQLGRGETVADTARVLGRMADAIMIRTDDHMKIEEMAAHAGVPIINGLTDLSHPCQIVADLMTVIEHGLALPGSQWAWLGDGNNVLHSIIEAAGLMKFDVRIGCPTGYEPSPMFIAEAVKFGASIKLSQDPAEVVKDADVVVTDTWISMGQAHAEEKLAAMMPYQVTEALMAQAKPDARFLHCLPAHRGEEVVDGVIDGPRSVIWDEAENRLHAQKSILLWAFGLLG